MFLIKEVCPYLVFFSLSFLDSVPGMENQAIFGLDKFFNI